MQGNFLIRTVYILALIVLAFIILHFLKFYFVPVIFSALFAMLMLPLCIRMERLKVPPIIASFICLFIILSVLAIIVAVFSSQVVSFVKALPEFENDLKAKFASID